jgi:hypothetical protein
MARDELYFVPHRKFLWYFPFCVGNKSIFWGTGKYQKFALFDDDQMEIEYNG